MRKQFSKVLWATLVVAIAAARPGLAQTEAQAVHSFLSGRTMMVTYRDAGPVYGTYLLENQERRSFSDQGTWSVMELGQMVVVRYRSVSGQVASFPVHLLPNGGISAGNGITVIPQGPAPCR
jgi:hypothetical protein